jgi:hypothetical protein
MPELLDGRQNSSPHFGNRGIDVFEQPNSATSGKRAPYDLRLGIGQDYEVVPIGRTGRQRI